jgi:hypothetical protein
MEDEDLEGLRENYEDNPFFQQKIKLEEWRDAHPDFTPKLIKY